jgi:hypothetical protein
LKEGWSGDELWTERTAKPGVGRNVDAAVFYNDITFRLFVFSTIVNVAKISAPSPDTQYKIKSKYVQLVKYCLSEYIIVVVVAIIMIIIINMNSLFI